MRVIGEDNVDKVAEMKKNYKEMKLDCLLCLGRRSMAEQTLSMEYGRSGRRMISAPPAIPA